MRVCWVRLKARQLNPNTADVLFVQLLGTRDFISYALGHLRITSVLQWCWPYRRRHFFFPPRAKDELPPSPLFLYPLLISHSSLLPPFLFSPSPPFRNRPLNTATGPGGALKAPTVGSGEKPQPTNDLVRIGVKKCSSGGSRFCWFDFPRNKCNFLHKNKPDRLYYGGCRRPMKKVFSWSSRHHCPMEVGAYAVAFTNKSASILLGSQHWRCPLLSSGAGRRYRSLSAARARATAYQLHFAAAAYWPWSDGTLGTDGRTDGRTPDRYIDALR